MIRLIVGDTKPDLSFDLERDGVYGTALTEEIASVLFKLRKPSGAEISVPLTLDSAALTRYIGNFASGDLDESADQVLFGEIVVTYTDGDTQHAEEPFEVYIRAEYGDFPR